MFNNLLGDKPKNQALSIIKDPFSVNKVDDIYIRYSTNWGKAKWHGSISFKNGNTIGEQKLLECDTLDDIVTQIKAIGESLKDKI